MKRLLCSAAATLLLLLPTMASADAAQDVKELRAGKLPVRYEWLGWSGSTANFRTLVCIEGGTTSCTAAFVEQSEAKLERVELLSVDELYCGPGHACAPLDAATVNAFVQRERVASAALAVLTPGRAATDPARVFGAVAGEATTVQLRARNLTNQEGPKIDTELVLRGKGGAIETLGVLDRAAYRFNGGAIQGAHLSDDGKVVAYAVRFNVGVMCWDFAGLQTVVVNLPRKRASLANTIGWRAHQKGDMAAARAGFIEATTLDPNFGLGWYNRACIESRSGDLAKAKSSFAQALKLDPRFALRACKDDDFKALRAAEPALFGC